MNIPSAIFACAGGSILYVLGLYPIGLAMYARHPKKAIRKEEIGPPVAIILPVRNGERWITAKLRSLFDSHYPSDQIRVIVVADGCSDATVSLVESFADSRVQLLQLPAGGKATAINQAVNAAEADILVFTDVRQQFDPLAIRHLVSCFADSRVAVATGELVISKSDSHEETNTGLYWKYEKWIRRNLNNIDCMLGATGAIYAVRRELVFPIPADTLLDDVQIPFAAAGETHCIYFECEAKAYDLPTNLNSEFKRKVRTQAGVYQIIRRFPKLLSPLNRRGFHFLSHKVGRLSLPFALIIMLFATPFLPPPMRWFALIGQLLFYGAALFDPVVPEHSALKKFTSIARTFLVLVAAAFCALTILFAPAQSLWKDTRDTAKSVPQR